MLIAAGGFILFVLIISWVFGREFADHTVKDLLAVPVHRSKHTFSEIYCNGSLVSGDKRRNKYDWTRHGRDYQASGIFS